MKQSKIILCFALACLAALSAQARAQAVDPVLNDEAIVLSTATGAIQGSLMSPPSKTALPVVLIIAGSGPTDRNGNNPAMKNNSLRKLAIGLALKGIASVRYDKRGVGASVAAGPREADLRFETYVDDAVAWLALLRQDKRFGTVSVVGHSEGALVGMLAAQSGKARAFVSIAGAGRPASAILREQLDGVLSPSMEKDSNRILATLESGREADAVPPTLGAIYRPSVQPYLISWFRYAPTATLAKLDMPVLIVQGTTDVQVKVAEAEALLKAKPGARLVLVQGMNHVLKIVEGDMTQQSASYKDPTLPIAPELVRSVSDFIHENR